MKSEIADRLRDLTRPTGTEDLLAVEYPRPRFRITLRHALILIALLSVGVGGWFLLQPPATEPPTVVELAQQPEPPQDAGIIVSVVGHVREPGLVTLPAESRVADALAAAGALEDADLTALNLAQVLVDGTQIHVLAVGEAPPAVPGAAAGAAVGGLIPLNTATVAELITLPGVGEKTAQAILDYRDTQGGFRAVEDLLGVKGIGQAKFEQIAPLVTP